METTKTVLAPGERITVIDALRGFSLIGICLIHSMQHFGAMGTMTSQAVFPWEGTMNEIFSWLINYLVFGKFFIIFSCLFGLSFFIQMDRAAKKGLDFRPRFLWRLVLLLAIGYLHGLIVRVDILLIYAILGFVLVLMYKWPTKLLAGITLFLFLGGATLVPVAYKSLTAPAVEQVERVAERPASRPAGPRKVPTLSETIESNAWDGIVGKMRFQVSSGRIYLTLGLFILGFIVGRIRLFERMGLTNYIAQSVIGVFIFSGFGLDWSHLGVFLSVLVCLAYTGVQIVFSHYWLKKFRYGPMEWLWRTGTYMKWQPLAR
ncbi:MAG: DUF418 domain-containing protein [Parabacteroides merdae]|jgi:hypothetical protein|uniref:DUF418 domain-containing protein n=1 Tax=Parabacteroides merdae TaxID=46503 RepID=UPI003562B716|nr:DUF418 domain-containing protein [Parabacteroides merdae]